MFAITFYKHSWLFVASWSKYFFDLNLCLFMCSFPHLWARHPVQLLQWTMHQCGVALRCRWKHKLTLTLASGNFIVPSEKLICSLFTQRKKNKQTQHTSALCNSNNLYGLVLLTRIICTLQLTPTSVHNNNLSLNFCACVQMTTVEMAAMKWAASSLAPIPTSSALMAAVSPTTGPATATTTVVTSATRP